MGAPQKAIATPKERAMRCPERCSDKRAQEPADAQGGVQVPDPRRTGVEKIERGYNHEHVQTTPDEALSAGKSYQQPQLRVTGDTVDPPDGCA